MANAGLYKAAVVLSSLPEKQAALLLEKMAPAEADAVRCQLAEIGQLGEPQRDTVLREFTAQAEVTCGQTPASCSDGNRAFRLVRGMPTERIVQLLGDEHPQVIALVLGHLPAPQAAAVLAAMPAELQATVVRRIATMEEPTADIVHDVDQAIWRRVTGGGSADMNDGMASIVKMLGAMEPARERKLLGDVAAADPDLLADIRRAMFGADVADCDVGLEAAAI